MVELLVIIAIIAILAGGLLPALARARSSAKKALCRNNLKQSSVGLQGDNIAQKNEADRIHYGQFLTAKDILFDKKAKLTDDVTEFVKRLTEHQARGGALSLRLHGVSVARA